MTTTSGGTASWKAPSTATDPAEADGGHLTHGWEPDLDVADSITRRFLFHYAESLMAPAEAAGGRRRRSDDVMLFERGPGASLYNGAVMIRPPLDRLDEVLDQVEDFVDAGTGETWLWSPWPMRDISRRGWRLEGHPPLLVRPPRPVAHRTPPAEISEVTSEEDLAVWERLVVENYPLDSLVPHTAGEPFHPGLLDDPRYTFLLGSIDGVPVAAAASFVDHGMASLAMGVTHSSMRRWGLWDAMVRARLARHPDLMTGGIFSDMSRPGAEERFGFIPVTRWTLWIRDHDSRRRAGRALERDT